MSTHRESAQALVRRLNAPHVCLQPTILHNATGSGLKRGDVLVVGGMAGSGKSHWASRVAASHLSKGGAVTFLFAPGGAGFNMRRFMEHLEAVSGGSTHPGTPGGWCGVGNGSDNFVVGDEIDRVDGAVSSCDSEVRRGVLLEALNRLTVVHCMDVNDLAVFCMHGRATAVTELCEAVPLVVVECCYGRGGYLHHFERAVGHQVPLCHWLFGCLQRRWRCALILVEEWGTASIDCVDTATSTRHSHTNTHIVSGMDELSYLVERESEILRAVQVDAASWNDARRGSTLSLGGPCGKSLGSVTTPSTPAVGSTNTELCFSLNVGNAISSPSLQTSLSACGNISRGQPGGSFNFNGTSRFYYLYIQSVPADRSPPSMTRSNVLVGRLLQWRRDELSTTDPNIVGSIEVLSEQQRRQKRAKAPRLRGDVLCGVQL